jgi:ankyrin repeat protein
VTASAFSDQTKLLQQMIQADPSLLKARSRANDILGGQATPLLVAASWDRVGAASTLLDAGATVDDVVAGKSGATALHLAAWNDDPALINLLLAHGAPLEAVSKSPAGTPLYWAVMRGGRNAVQSLLDRGATVTSDMIDLASRGVKRTDPASLPGNPTDYSAIALMLRDRLAAAPATAPAAPSPATKP